MTEQDINSTQSQHLNCCLPFQGPTNLQKKNVESEKKNDNYNPISEIDFISI